MAKYAQGYARKNSDTKNLIILISSIVLVVAAVIVGVILFNKFKKDKTVSFSDAKYESAFITDYDKLLDQDKREDNEGCYILYLCSKSSTTPSKIDEAVMKYLNEGKGSIKLYLVNYDDFDTTSDQTESATHEKVEAALGFEPTLGCLIYVDDNEIKNQSKQVITDSEKAQEKLNYVLKEGKWY